MGMSSKSVSSWPFSLLTAVLTASFCIQVFDCPAPLAVRVGLAVGALFITDASLLLGGKICVEVDELDLLAELGVGPLGVGVEPVVAVGNQPPLGVQPIVAFCYESCLFPAGRCPRRVRFRPVAWTCTGWRCRSRWSGRWLRRLCRCLGWWSPGAAVPGQAIPPMSSNGRCPIP